MLLGPTAASTGFCRSWAPKCSKRHLRLAQCPEKDAGILEGFTELGIICDSLHVAFQEWRITIEPLQRDAIPFGHGALQRTFDEVLGPRPAAVDVGGEIHHGSGGLAGPRDFVKPDAMGMRPFIDKE